MAVVIPCYGEGALVAQAVASVNEYEPVELVVVDDGSQDSTTIRILSKLEEDGIKVVRHPENRGLPAARTSGLRATQARYIFPLDADDLAVPNVLGPMADELDVNADAVVCYGDYAEFGSDERLRRVPEEIDAFRIAYTNEYPVSSLYRRDVLEELNAWDPLPAYEDWSLWMTFAERGLRGVHFGPGVVTYRRRIHGERMLTRAKRVHPKLYRRLRALHPQLYAEIATHRRNSPLGATRKRLYPLVYGGRRRFPYEHRIKGLLERLGVWTVQR